MKRAHRWTALFVGVGCLALVLFVAVPFARWIAAGANRVWSEWVTPPGGGVERRAVVVVVWPRVTVDRERNVVGTLTSDLAGLRAYGVTFERHVPSAEGTAAALATLLTGLPPSEHGLGSLRTPGRQRLDAALPTFVDAYAEQGWRTLGGVRPWYLDGELTGFARPFETWFQDGDAVPDALEPWLAELERLLAGGQDSVVALWCEAPPTITPSPRGRRAQELVKFALSMRAELVLRQDLRELRERLRGADVADGDVALDELDALLLRRRGDPARAALLQAYHDVELEELSRRLGRIVELLRGRYKLEWTVVVTGSSAAPLTELKERVGELADLPETLRVPLVIGGWPKLEPHGDFVALTRDLDLARLLFAGADARAPLHLLPSSVEVDRSSAVVHGAQLTDAVVWLEAQPLPAARFVPVEREDGVLVRLTERTPHPGRLVSVGPGEEEVRGSIELAWRGLAGREVVVRSLVEGALLHAPDRRPGRPRVVLRLGLDAEPPIVLHGERRAAPLSLRLPVMDEASVFVGGRALNELDVALVPASHAAPWPLESTPTVAVVELGGGRRGVRVHAAPEAEVRLVLEAHGPDPYAAPEVRGFVGDAAHPRRPLAREVEARGSFELEVSLPVGAVLSIAAFVDGERVPAARMSYADREFAGEGLELALTAWCFSDPELHGPALSQLPEGALSVTLLDLPPPKGPVVVPDERVRSALERLGAHE